MEWLDWYKIIWKDDIREGNEVCMLIVGLLNLEITLFEGDPTYHLLQNTIFQP